MMFFLNLIKNHKIINLERVANMHLTRHLLNYKQVKENRKVSLEMAIDQKRKLYKCKNDYIMLDKIPTWDEYYKKHDLHLSEEIKSKNESNEQPKAVRKELNTKISIINEDITLLEIDAIVNAANKSLLGGGGVDGAIHRAAGNQLLQECKILNGCQTSEAKDTAGYNLPARYVIHTVGPIGEKPDALKNAYLNCLEVAVKNGCKTIAFPCISTGVYGYPNESAAILVTQTIREYLEANHENFDRIIFCLFLDKDVKLYHKYLAKCFPVIEDKAESETETEAKENEPQKL